MTELSCHRAANHGPSAAMSTPDEDIEIVPIPMDRETIANLARLGRVLGEHPLQVLAPSILRAAVSAAAMELALRPENGTLN